MDKDKLTGLTGADTVLVHLDLRPAAIIRDLDLLRPVYGQTAACGYFGRDLPVTWERTDRVETLRRTVGAPDGERAA
ncbi:methionine adenosyltransferase domain-containing protein [Streptomyces sioyaensis]|uniref:methionine adenosyltransferase domain-containing protein n=1 Tax=Streptomyces sioyaensis TaxID=67364 RepID=UPI00378FFBB6